MQYFNVRKLIRIDGTLFLPAVSYPLPSAWEKGIKELQDKGKAVITDHIVTFQNGKPVHEDDAEAENRVFGGK